MRNHFSAECLFTFPHLAACLPAGEAGEALMALRCSLKICSGCRTCVTPREATQLPPPGAPLCAPRTGQDGIPFYYCSVKQKAPLVFTGDPWRKLAQPPSYGGADGCFFIFSAVTRLKKVKKRNFYLSSRLCCGAAEQCGNSSVRPSLPGFTLLHKSP